jgi:Mg2+-importing ATPase
VLVMAALAVSAVAAALPFTPLAQALGLQPLPGVFYAALAGMTLCYLVLLEAAKRRFWHGQAHARAALSHSPAA